MVKRILRFAAGILGFVLVLGCISYLVDFGMLRWKFAHGGKVFEKVIVRRVFTVPHKDGKTEYLEDDDHAESCVNSLYPHSAVPPCWYLNRHRERKINL